MIVVYVLVALALAALAVLALALRILKQYGRGVLFSTRTPPSSSPHR
jgi:hypothetical protein